jgi:hypothetical protein
MTFIESIFTNAAKIHWNLLTDASLTFKVILIIGITLTLLLVLLKHLSKNNKTVNKIVNQNEINIVLSGNTAVNGMLITFSLSILAYILISFNNAHTKEFIRRSKKSGNNHDIFTVLTKKIPGI